MAQSRGKYNERRRCRCREKKQAERKEDIGSKKKRAGARETTRKRREK